MPAVVLRALDGLGLGETARDWSHRSDDLAHPADGLVSAVFALALLAALAALTVGTAQRARGAPSGDVSRGRGAHRPLDGGGRAAAARVLVLGSLAAVLAFAALGKVLSPQYLIWIVPLGALALAWRMVALAALVALACVLTQIEFPARYFDLVDRRAVPGRGRRAARPDAARRARRSAWPRSRRGGSARRHQQLLDPRSAPVVAGLDQHAIHPRVLVGGLEADLASA